VTRRSEGVARCSEGVTRSRPDTLGMWEATAQQPERVSAALIAARRALEEARIPDTIRAVALFGVGAGGIAGAAAATLAAAHSRVPIWVGAGPALPGFVDPETLVLAVSCSGTSSTTVAAATAAIEAGSPVVVIAPDGPFTSLDDHVIARCPVAPPGPAGRSATGSAAVSILVALNRAGLALDPGHSVKDASVALARRRDLLFQPSGPAERVAQQIGRTIPLVYGSAGESAVAARHWKSQINLNAKAPAFCAALPDLAYDELAGWGQSGDVTRQVASMILLRHDAEEETTARMFEVVTEKADEVMAIILEVHAQGDDGLARFLDLALFGDVVSLQLAEREGVDPGPVPTVDDALDRTLT
jgi:glucose/mannose-6-phosphate isomerase